MQLRFGIPLTILLLAVSTWISGSLPFNAYYLLVGSSAIWAASDSRRIGIERYQSALALPPIGILVGFVIAWPIVFPWYLRVRYRIRTSLLGPREARRNVGGWVLVGVLGALFIAAVILSQFPPRPLKE